MAYYRGDGGICHELLRDLGRLGAITGVVAQGTLGPDGVLHASEVLAKHDENYMPPEAARALDQAKDMEKVKNSANEAAKTLSK